MITNIWNNFVGIILSPIETKNKQKKNNKETILKIKLFRHSVMA